MLMVRASPGIDRLFVPADQRAYHRKALEVLALERRLPIGGGQLGIGLGPRPTAKALAAGLQCVAGSHAPPRSSQALRRFSRLAIISATRTASVPRHRQSILDFSTVAKHHGGMTASSQTLQAAAVLSELRECGVTHIVWLPDSETGYMYEAMRSSELTLVPVCREGESMAIAAGLIMGGKRPVVLIQSTGLYESGDSVRGICLDLHLPLLFMIGYRGYMG